MKRTALIITTAAALILGGASTATAIPYTDGSTVIVSSPTVSKGAKVTITWTVGSFHGRELVSVVVIPPAQNGGKGHLALLNAAAPTMITKTAAADGSLVAVFTAPTGVDDGGVYTIRGSGQDSGASLAGAVTVVPADAAIAVTGVNNPSLLIWFGTGARSRHDLSDSREHGSPHSPPGRLSLRTRCPAAR